MSVDKEKLEQIKKILGTDTADIMRIPMVPNVSDKDLVDPVDTLYNDFISTINGIKLFKKTMGDKVPEEFYKSVIFFQRVALGCVLDIFKKVSELNKGQ